MTIRPGLVDEIRALAAEYYAATGKPLGVTGELAELEAARLLGIELAQARQAGFDGWVMRDGNKQRVQIKGRAVPPDKPYRGRCPAIKYGDLCDLVVLVLIDKRSYRPIEIWETTEAKVAVSLSEPGSKSRNERNSMGLSQFKSIAERVWLAPAT